jgi:hypothetical protein
MKTVNASRNKKRILAVRIITECDTNPDTSYLGEYSNRADSDYSIDRAHSEDCASLFPMTGDAINTLTHACNYIQSLRVDSELDSPEDMEIQTAIATIDDLISEYEERDCDCGGHNYNSREYRYFNPSFNYVGKDGTLHETPENIRKYTRQDYDRMESLNNGHWCYIGIRAEAEIAVPGGRGPDGCATIQRISSGGLWGIESDSDKSYFADVQKEELSELKSQLLALGFSKRAIATAFKNVEEKQA